MCNQREVTEVLVKIPADLSSTGQTKWKNAKIDTCIAPMVKALQLAGIDMRGSCCGHEKTVGDIHLQDGRLLIILNAPRSEAWMYGDVAARRKIMQEAIQ